jgi:hypothetical protein
VGEGLMRAFLAYVLDTYADFIHLAAAIIGGQE